MLLNAANIGVSWWSHDVGGNHGGIEDGELYIRYIQLGTFLLYYVFIVQEGLIIRKNLGCGMLK